MPVVTPISLTLSNGFIQWSRDANEVEIDPNASTADQVAAIYAAVALGYPITFQRGAIYDDLPAFDFYTAIPYIAWYGDASKARPRLRWRPDATHGFYLQWMKTSNTTGFKFIGLDCDGSNTGTYEPYSNWIKADFMCLHMRRTSNSSTTSHAGIVIEDNIFRRWDEAVLIADDKLRNTHNTVGAGDTEGAFEFAIRRNMFLDICGDDNHSIAVYIEGAKNGSLIEQNYFSYTGYLKDYGRNQPDFARPADPIADKRSHAIYWQFINGEGVIRENIMYQQGANMAQHRTPGIFDYNVGFYCAMTNNTGDVGGEGGHTGSSRVRGNLFGHQVDINNIASDHRGAGFEMNRSPGGLTIDENIAFDRRGSATGGGGVAMNVFNTIDSVNANVFVDWYHTGGQKDSGGKRIDVTGLALNVGGKYREIRANPPADRPADQQNETYVDQKPSDYPDNYQVPAPTSGYTAAGWPDITPEDDILLRGRRLGEWRSIDHVSHYIDPARVLAKAAIQAEYGVNETSLDPVTWSTNTLINNGIGGNQDDTPLNLSPDGYDPDEEEPVQSPNVDAGLDISTTASTVGPIGAVSDPLGRPITIQWTQVSGPNTATLYYADGIAPFFDGLIVGTYVFRCTATAGGVSASDTMTVVVRSATPTPAAETNGRYSDLITALEATSGPTNRTINMPSRKVFNATDYVRVLQDNITVEGNGATLKDWPINVYGTEGGPYRTGVTIRNLRIDTGEAAILDVNSTLASGTAATTNGTTLVSFLAPDNPTLTGIGQNDIIFLSAETTGRGSAGTAFAIASVDNDAKTVTLAPGSNLPGSNVGQSWSIGDSKLQSSGADCIAGIWAENLTFENLSLWRSTDENAEFFDTISSSYRYCLIAEPINEGLHYKGDHGHGMGLVGRQSGWSGDPLTIERNLFYQCKGRHPSIFPYGDTDPILYANGYIYVRIINNVIYGPTGVENFLSRLGSRDAPLYGTGNFKVDYCGNVIILPDNTAGYYDFLKTVLNKAPWTDMYQADNWVFLPDGTYQDLYEWASDGNQTFIDDLATCRTSPNFALPSGYMTDPDAIIQAVTQDAGATPRQRHPEDRVPIAVVDSWHASNLLSR